MAFDEQLAERIRTVLGPGSAALAEPGARGPGGRSRRRP
jgi:hypothetical protein